MVENDRCNKQPSLKKYLVPLILWYDLFTMKNYIFFLQFSNTLNIKYIQFNPQILGLMNPT